LFVATPVVTIMVARAQSAPNDLTVLAISNDVDFASR
jgi:hypothetical protein